MILLNIDSNKIEILFSGSNHKVSNNDYYNSQYTVSQYLTEFLEKIIRKISVFGFKYQGNDSLILQQFYQFLHM